MVGKAEFEAVEAGDKVVEVDAEVAAVAAAVAAEVDAEVDAAAAAAAEAVVGIELDRASALDDYTGD